MTETIGIQGRTWTIRIPFAGEWLTSNPRSTGNRYGRSRAIKDWRNATSAVCHAEKLPTGLQRVRLDFEVHFTGRAPARDRLNLAPTIKAAVDGLTPLKVVTRKDGVRYTMGGYGLIPDDSDRHVASTDWIQVPASVPCLMLTITEVLDG